jgi:hypothetical protein
MSGRITIKKFTGDDGTCADIYKDVLEATMKFASSLRDVMQKYSISEIGRSPENRMRLATFAHTTGFNNIEHIVALARDGMSEAEILGEVRKGFALWDETEEGFKAERQIYADAELHERELASHVDMDHLEEIANFDATGMSQEEIAHRISQVLETIDEIMEGKRNMRTGNKRKETLQ